VPQVGRAATRHLRRGCFARTIGLEQINSNNVPEEVEDWVDHLRNRAHEEYTPISFWDDLDVYVEVATEKLDLRNLFEPAPTRTQENGYLVRGAACNLPGCRCDGVVIK
jgi:hypothetical protein